MAGYTIRSIFDLAVEALSAEYQSDEAISAVRILLEHHLQAERYAELLRPQAPVARPDADALLLSLRRLCAHEPLQYVLGCAHFMGMELEVDARALIPRPETEELVLWAQQSAHGLPCSSLLDVGTGSGCIAVALARLLPGMEVHALDVSPSALALAERNARRCDVAVQLHHHDILAAEPFAAGPFGMLVSNPPYVLERERALMRPNVLLHEPAVALFVPDADPLLFYRAIAHRARSGLLVGGGAMLFEINEAQGQAVCDLLRGCGFVRVELRRDLFGKERMVRCFAPPAWA
ncbi:MAG: peptide chain release factor N(5)-glutamine methyltransferase [Bacteroidales bacterium]|nr:peptide chain release factor N(5)-glutamine methyltransferase [Bacteroidales bacterium]